MWKTCGFLHLTEFCFLSSLAPKCIVSPADSKLQQESISSSFTPSAPVKTEKFASKQNSISTNVSILIPYFFHNLFLSFSCFVNNSAKVNFLYFKSYHSSYPISHPLSPSIIKYSFFQQIGSFFAKIHSLFTVTRVFSQKCKLRTKIRLKK